VAGGRIHPLLGVVFGRGNLPHTSTESLTKASLKSLWNNLELQDVRRMKLFRGQGAKKQFFHPFPMASANEVAVMQSLVSIYAMFLL